MIKNSQQIAYVMISAGDVNQAKAAVVTWVASQGQGGVDPCVLLSAPKSG